MHVKNEFEDLNEFEVVKLQLHWCSKTSLEWNEEEENESRLASADIGGLIVICDALMATVVSQFRLTSATVLCRFFEIGSRDHLD